MAFRQDIDEDKRGELSGIELFYPPVDEPERGEQLYKAEKAGAAARFEDVNGGVKLDQLGGAKPDHLM
jgi:hypothetical protein